MPKWILAAAALTFAGLTQAAEMDLSPCALPDAPEVPDGSQASEDEMGTAGAEVREYVTAVQESLQCLAEVEQSMGEEITEEQQAELVETYNSGVDQMNAVAERYNEQVRAFKEQ